MAAGATVLSTVLGTLLAVGLPATRRSRLLDALAMAPAVLPDLVLAIGLLVFYALVEPPSACTRCCSRTPSSAWRSSRRSCAPGWRTLDTSLEEASRDLGAGRFTTFMRVTLPQLAPGIVAGALLAFTLSLDEFVIAFFTDGADRARPCRSSSTRWSASA